MVLEAVILQWEFVAFHNFPCLEQQLLWSFEFSSFFYNLSCEHSVQFRGIRFESLWIQSKRQRTSIKASSAHLIAAWHLLCGRQVWLLCAKCRLQFRPMHGNIGQFLLERFRSVRLSLMKNEFCIFSLEILCIACQKSHRFNITIGIQAAHVDIVQHAELWAFCHRRVRHRLWS